MTSTVASIAVRLAFGLVASVWGVSCAAANFQRPPTMPASFGKPFIVDAREPWSETGLPLVKGWRYCITCVASPDYKDSLLSCTAAGPKGAFGGFFDNVARDVRTPLSPVWWLGPGEVKHLRVLEDSTGTRAHFLTAIAAVGRDDKPENVIVIGDGRCFEAPASGQLVLFANDWPGLKHKPQAPDDYYSSDGGRVLSRSYINNKGTLTVTVTPGK